MTDDFASLIQADHWLGWLGDNPAEAIRSEIQKLLREQVPTAQLDWIHLIGKPEFLTGGRTIPHDPDKIIMTRTALAVSFQLQVTSQGGSEQLRGVFSWVATGLDTERRDQIHFDLNVDMPWAVEMLKVRIYENNPVSQSPDL